MKRVRLLISGRVQGVNYRSFSHHEALKRGLTGYARNLPVGTVEILLEGDGSEIEDFITWCHKGSPYARVEAVEATIEPYQGEFQNFEIR